MTPHRGHRLGLTLPVKEARDEEARQVFELGGRNMHRGEDAADLLGTRRIKLRQQWRQAGINLHRREGGIVHVQNDTLGTVHKTNAVLRNLGNNGCGDARVAEHDAAAAVRTLDTPEKGAFFLRLNPFAPERDCARCSADKVAACQRHDAARAIGTVGTRRMRLGSGWM